MQKELNSLRQDLKKVLVGLTQFQEYYKDDLKSLYHKDGTFRTPVPVLFYYCLEKTGPDLEKQIENIIGALPKEVKKKNLVNIDGAPVVAKRGQNEHTNKKKLAVCGDDGGSVQSSKLPERPAKPIQKPERKTKTVNRR